MADTGLTKPVMDNQWRHNGAGNAATTGAIGARSRPRSNGGTGARMAAVRPADLASMAVARGPIFASRRGASLRGPADLSAERN